MIGLDTNVLIRYIVQDDPKQSRDATYLIEQQCSTESPGWICTIVLCELCWVLSRAYGYEKRIIINVLRQLLSSVELRVDHSDSVWAALHAYEKGNADFSDYLIGQYNHSNGCSHTVTFDRKAADGIYFEGLTK